MSEVPTASAPRHDEKFPINPFTLWRLGTLSATAGALIAAASHWLSGAGSFEWPKSLAVGVGAAITVICAYYLQPTVANERGLFVTNMWGFRRWLAWSDMDQVGQSRYILLLPYLRIAGKDGKSYWLSRDTVRLKDLFARVVAEAGPDHPLAKALSTPLYQLK